MIIIFDFLGSRRAYQFSSLSSAGSEKQIGRYLLRFVRIIVFCFFPNLHGDSVTFRFGRETLRARERALGIAGASSISVFPRADEVLYET